MLLGKGVLALSDLRHSNGTKPNEENERLVQTRYITKRVAQDTDEIEQADQLSAPAPRMRNRRSGRAHDTFREDEDIKEQQTAVFDRQVQGSFETRRMPAPTQKEAAPRVAAPARQPVDAPGYSRAKPMPNAGSAQSRRPEPPLKRDYARAPEYDEYEDEDELPRKRKGRPVLTALVVILLVLAAGIVGLMLWPEGDTGFIGTVNTFKQNILGAFGNIQNAVVPEQKEAAEALDFAVVPMQAQAPADVVFTLMTTKTVDGVRVTDTEGSVIRTIPSLAVNETAYIWSLTATIMNGFSGDVEAWIQTEGAWTNTGMLVHLEIEAPTPTPTPVMIMMATDVPAAVTQTPAPIQEPLITQAPTATPTSEPTPSPTPTATPTPTPEPTATPMPLLGASAADAASPSTLKLTDKIYFGTKKLTDLTREAKDQIRMSAPDLYSDWPGGVFAFRGGPFRQNAAFGTADIQAKNMQVLWDVPVGSIETYHGIGWTGQPIIVKWPKEMREMMNINDEKKAASALREVIISAQDGKVYFLDLKDGQPTRDTININYPLKGSVSLYPVATKPILSVGQAVSKIGGKTGEIGNYLFNLLDQKKLHFTDGRDKNAIWTNGAFDGSALFDRVSDTMILAGENGVLYTLKLNTEFNFNEKTLTATKPTTTSFTSKAAKEKNNQVGVETSVAMYGSYAYYADTYGILRCVDTDTMTTVWAMDTGDNTDASIALDMESSSTVALYTANTLIRQGKKGVCTVRRLNALTGEEDWKVEINCTFNDKSNAGAMASPVVGQNTISNLVIFTIARTEEGGAVIAFDKTTGSIVWQQNMANFSHSSPVAVYNDQGDAWVIQGDSAGVIQMLDGQTGSVLTSLQLEGAIDASPAVYNDILVVGTSKKGGSHIYGIALK